MSRRQQQQFGGPAIYILRPVEIVGLEFDEVIIHGAELLTGDITLPTQRSILVGMANAVTRRLTITWSGHGQLPSLIRALHQPQEDSVPHP